MAKQTSDKKLTISVDGNERAQHCSECHTKLLVQEYQDFYQDECSACRLGVFRSGGCDCGPCIPKTTVLTACPLCKFCKLHDNAPEWNNVRTKFECKKCRLYTEERQLVESHCRSVELCHRRRVEFYKKWHVRMPTIATVCLCAVIPLLFYPYNQYLQLRYLFIRLFISRKFFQIII